MGDVRAAGALMREHALAALAEQASALSARGADLLVLETFFAGEEALWAAQAVREATDLPLVLSFGFDQGTKTMIGLAPRDVAGGDGVAGAGGARCQLRAFCG